MKRIFICLLLVYSIVMLTACPKPADIQKAKTESAKLASYANTGVELTRTLFQTQVISIGIKDKVADGFITLAQAGQAFDLLVKNAEAQYGSAIPKSEIAKLFATFDQTVITKFLAVFATITGASIPGKYVALFETIKAAVLLIGGAFNFKSAVQARLAAAGV